MQFSIGFRSRRVKFGSLYIRNCLSYRPGISPDGFSLKYTIFIDGSINSKIDILAVLVQGLIINDFFSTFLRGVSTLEACILETVQTTCRSGIDPIGLRLKKYQAHRLFGKLKNIISYKIMFGITRYAFFLYVSEGGMSTQDAYISETA